MRLNGHILAKAFAALCFCVYIAGCSGASNPVGPANKTTPIPSPQVLWDNGSPGTFFGQGVTVTSATGYFYTTGCVDSINNESLGLWDTYDVYFTAAAPVDASAYANGHIQFDMLLQSYSAIPPLTLFLENSQNNSVGARYYVPTTGLNASTFTHVSVPLSAFTPMGGSPLSSMDRLIIQYYGATYVLCQVQLTWD